MNKLTRFVKKYWVYLLVIPVGILVWRYFPRKAFAKGATKPNVSRPPIDSSPHNDTDSWGAVDPATVPLADIVSPWDDITPKAGDMADLNNEPVSAAIDDSYNVGAWNPVKDEEVQFAGSKANVGGYY